MSKQDGELPRLEKRALGEELTTSRRGFLKMTALTAGGFFIGAQLCLAKGALAKSLLSETGRSPAGSDHWLNTWVGVGGDGAVHFFFARAEMGQGVLTTLIAIVGEEFGLDPAKIVANPAPIDKAHGNPKMFGEQVTGGSTTIAGSFDPLRQAAAAARDMMIQAGAKALGAQVSNCHVDNGQIVDYKSGKRVNFAQIVDAAAKLDVPRSPRLKPRSEYRYLGKAQPRRDLYDKVTGRTQYGIDVNRTASGDPLSCVIIRCPVRGGKLKNPGLYRTDEGLVPLKNGVAVTAPTHWEALKKSRTLAPEWDLAGSTSNVNSSALRQQYLKTSESGGDVVSIEPVTAILGGVPEGSVKATYELPYLPHATMEPMNCTADVRKDGCDLWAPTQVPGAAREITAAITGLALDKITVQPLLLGGAFGRRCYLDYVAEAVQVSKVLGKPVKVIWTREDDFQNDFYRPAITHAISGSVGGNGEISSWKHHVVGQSLLHYASDTLADGLPVDLPNWGEKLIAGAFSGFFRGVTKLLPDPMSFDGILMETSDLSLTHLPFEKHIPYQIDRFEVRSTTVDLKIPIGFWRSVGHSHTAFAIESFVDELAHSAGIDPYQFRLKLLPANNAKVARNRRVLMTAATQAGWGAAPRGVYQGIAQHECFDTYTAHVVEIAKTQDGLRLHRVVSAVDCGFILDPDIVTAQVEGAVIFGLTAALKQEITFVGGRAQQANFNNSDLLRMHECPQIDVHFAGGSDAPTGIGEAGVPGIAPALANAIFAATGVRQRKLPFQF